MFSTTFLFLYSLGFYSYHVCWIKINPTRWQTPQQVSVTKFTLKRNNLNQYSQVGRPMHGERRSRKSIILQHFSTSLSQTKNKNVKILQVINHGSVLLQIFLPVLFLSPFIYWKSSFLFCSLISLNYSNFFSLISIHTHTQTTILVLALLYSILCAASRALD